MVNGKSPRYYFFNCHLTLLNVSNTHTGNNREEIEMKRRLIRKLLPIIYIEHMCERFMILYMEVHTLLIYVNVYILVLIQTVKSFDKTR